MLLFKISHVPEVINCCLSLGAMLQNRSFSEAAQKTDVLETPLMYVIFLKYKLQNFFNILKFLFIRQGKKA